MKHTRTLQSYPFNPKDRLFFRLSSICLPDHLEHSHTHGISLASVFKVLIFEVNAASEIQSLYTRFHLHQTLIMISMSNAEAG